MRAFVLRIECVCRSLQPDPDPTSAQIPTTIRMCIKHFNFVHEVQQVLAALPGDPIWMTPVTLHTPKPLNWRRQLRRASRRRQQVLCPTLWDHFHLPRWMTPVPPVWTISLQLWCPHFGNIIQQCQVPAGPTTAGPLHYPVHLRRFETSVQHYPTWATRWEVR